MKLLFCAIATLGFLCSVFSQRQSEIFTLVEFENALRCKTDDTAYFRAPGDYTGKAIPVSGTPFEKAKFGQLFVFLPECTISVDSVVPFGTGQRVWLGTSSGLLIGPLFSPREYEKGNVVRMYAMKWADAHLMLLIAPYWPPETNSPSGSPKKLKKKHA